MFNIPERRTKSEASLSGQLIWQQAKWSWKVKMRKTKSIVEKQRDFIKMHVCEWKGTNTFFVRGHLICLQEILSKHLHF